METSPVTSPAGGNTITGTTSLADNFYTFLQLLTTQLQHQDPLSPMETAEFTNQLTQFSQVEQAIKTNTQLETLISLNQTSQALSALNYLGRTVEATGDATNLSGGEAMILYSLPPGTAAAILTIRGGGGGPVCAITAETGDGRHEFMWDGTNDQGTLVPDGAYQVSVSALDGDGNVIPGALTGLAGIVDEVITESAPAVLMVGDVPIEIGDIVAIRE